jgi:tetratricopeptide (TPR) repeat protein
MSVQNELLSAEVPSWSVQFRGWRRTRDYVRLLFGLPSLLALVLLGGYGIFLYGWKPAHAEARAYNVARNAFQGLDFERARIAYQSLLQLGGKERQEYAYRLMLAQMRLGMDRDAALMALALAPPNRLGYAPAHLFMARSLLTATNITTALIERAASHLERVLISDPSNLEAHDLLSQIYMSSGRMDAAKRHLLELVSSSGDAMLRLAVVMAAEGDANGTRYWAERAAKFFRSKVEQNKTDDFASRLSWANALMLQEDFTTAWDLLAKADKEFGNPAYKNALGRIAAEWAQNLARRAPKDLAGRFKILQRGLDVSPRNQTLVQQVVGLTTLTGPEAEQARTMVKQMLVEGRDTGLVHFCLGAMALESGQPEKAFEHFRLAYEIAPDMPDIANNMALTLIMQPQPDLDRALGISTSIIERQPKNPAYRETRGQILVRQGKYHEAIQDLAFALPLLPDKSAIHRALAECYRHLKMNDLAEDHERAASGTAGKVPADPAAKPAKDKP